MWAPQPADCLFVWSDAGNIFFRKPNNIDSTLIYSTHTDTQRTFGWADFSVSKVYKLWFWKCCNKNGSVTDFKCPSLVQLNKSFE